MWKVRGAPQLNNEANPKIQEEEEIEFYYSNLFSFTNISIDCVVETRNYSMHFLAFIASSVRVTEEK